jgi:H-NS histone-like proteins, N-terminal domain
MAVPSNVADKLVELLSKSSARSFVLSHIAGDDYKYRAALKNMGYEEIELLISSASDILKDKEPEYRAELKEREDKRKAISAAQKLLKAQGLDFEDALQIAGHSKPVAKISGQKAKRKVTMKYKFTDAAGEVFEWGGLGPRTRKDFQAVIDDCQCNLEDLLVENDFRWHKTLDDLADAA